VTKLQPTGNALAYSTYLGGTGDEEAVGIAVDGPASAHVVGTTSSLDFPTANAVQANYGGGSHDVFVTKLNPTGSALVYSTYLGGISLEHGGDITLDALPNASAFAVGDTSSTNFPTTPGAFQTSYAGGPTDAFVSKLTDIVVPPPPTEGKVTGGGSIDGGGNIQIHQ
jgi:hypothetical protein